MARVIAEGAEVNARILYWGIEGAGKRTSLTKVSEKLRTDHRGELTETPTRIDPSVGFTVLPIELGDIAGMRTRIELVAVPGGAEHGATRKQLLDQVDGVVLVIDAQQSRIEENAAIVNELRKSLGDYARRLEDLPHVVQYNKRDLSDAYVIDELHRCMGLGSATVFETVASESTGVLQALSTISKKVIRSLRGESIGGHRPVRAPAPESPTPAPPPIAVAPTPTPTAAPAPAPVPDESIGPAAFVESLPSPASALEDAILAEAEGTGPEAEVEVPAADDLFDQPWQHESDALEVPQGVRLSPELSIISVGQATRADERSVRVPLVLGDGDGGTSTLVLTVRLDPLIDEMTS
jgi:signal recognition particle receptor subunit beta